jgi:ribosomal peptide maturation radical SAM protein 1
MPSLPWPVVLVSMPLMDAERPSIQLGLLAEIGRRHGFPVRTLHANLDLAARVGLPYYQKLAEHRGVMLGDWLFSVAAFGEAAPDPEARLLDDFADRLAHLGGSAADRRERLRRIRDDEVPRYLDALLDSFDWHPAQVVGFSCTFQQTTASIALARRLKQRFPDVVTVFGGAAVDAEMGTELVRAVDVIDLAVAGEADVAWPRLLHALAEGGDVGAVPGVVRRAAGRVVATPPQPPVATLDDLPVPDYAEYFDRARALGLLTAGGQRRVWIPVETARGCWWGAVHHCTFCGLNGRTMRFRAKTPQRVHTELSTLARRHGSFRFAAVDNILDPDYLRTLFPALADAEAGYEMFYEVKSNLTRAQVQVLARAGVTHIQPGLESLSSPVLRLMRKGVTAAQNVNLLRWARYYGIQVAWNLLWGFPGETAAHYAEQAALVPLLHHLEPPGGADRVWMERFSPLYAEPDRFPVRSRTPERSYTYVYPPQVDLDEVAYFFDHEFAGALPDSAYDGLRDAVDGWHAQWRQARPPTLTYRYVPGYLRIDDARHAGRDGTYTFEGAAADVYVACADRPTSAAAIARRAAPALDPVAVEEILEDFHRCGLMYRDGRREVALALPAAPAR